MKENHKIRGSTAKYLKITAVVIEVLKKISYAKRISICIEERGAKSVKDGVKILPRAGTNQLIVLVKNGMNTQKLYVGVADTVKVAEHIKKNLDEKGIPCQIKA